MDEQSSAATVEISPPIRMVEDGSSHVLFLLLPGVLMRAQTGFEPVLYSVVWGAIESGAAASVSYVDYNGDSVDPKSAAESILGAVRGMGADLIVPVALSYSAGDILNELYEQADSLGLPFAKSPIMVDPPQGASTLKPALWATKLVSLVPLSQVQKFFIDAAPLPSPKNIGNAGDFASITGDARVQSYADYVPWVIEKARSNLRDFPHSPGLFRAQAAQMAAYRGPSAKLVSLTRPILVVCTSSEVSSTWTVFEEDVDPEISGPDGTVPVQRPKNGTVVQPHAADRLINAFGCNIDVLAIRSTHCGFYERPMSWDAVIKTAVRMAVAAGRIG